MRNWSGERINYFAEAKRGSSKWQNGTCAMKHRRDEIDWPRSHLYTGCPRHVFLKEDYLSWSLKDGRSQACKDLSVQGEEGTMWRPQSTKELAWKQRFSSSTCIRVPGGLVQHTPLGLAPGRSVQWVWSGAWELSCLKHSQMMLMQLS